MVSSVAALHGPGLPAHRVARLAAAFGVAVWPPAAGDPVSGGVLVVADGDGDLEAADLWSLPFAAWIEIAGLTDDALAQAVGRIGSAHLFASLTTGTANELHVAGRIVTALHSRRPLTDMQRDDVELAIHEAVSNAVVHGNLQVDGMKGLSMAALERFSSELAARMADPAFARRRLEVSATIEAAAVVIDVCDEGPGFTPSPKAEAGGASGRGLDLIQAIAERCDLLDGGRRIRMRFRL